MTFKRIEMAGFKSFADKTKVEFDSGITAIVGPNGCGKSNVADAIRWVLGEQRSKALRGNKMQDVIFAGTTERKSLSFCEVNLVFDNTTRIFDIDYDELSISRKLYRSGESEYSINKNTCRLKDITNVLYNSGIGKEGYSIIGQGKVEEILNSKPINRRNIFEDAAGISGFKAKKTDAERKLNRTRDNLTRLKDIIFEIERQLLPMREQAETAKQYLKFKEDLKHYELNNYIYQYDNASANKENISNKIKALEEELELREADLNNAIIKSNENTAEIKNIDATVQRLNNELLELTVSLEKHSGNTKVLKEKIAYLKYLTERAEKIEEKIDTETSKFEESNKGSLSQNDAVSDLENERNTLQTKLDESNNDYNAKLSAVNKMNEQYITTKTALNNIEHRTRMLREMQKEFEGFAGSVKRVLKESNVNRELKSKIVGVVANLMDVPSQYATAIEMALGNAVQNIVTNDEDDAKYIVNVLKEKRYGRATLLPISSIKPRFIRDDLKGALNTKGCLGVASDLIEYDKKLDKIFKGLLGSTVIVDTLQTAVNLAKDTRYGFRIVSLEGDIINPQGSITGGSKKNKMASLVGREGEIEELAIQEEKLKIELSDLIRTRQQMLSMTQKLNTEVKELSTKVNNINIFLAQAKEKQEKTDFVTNSARAEIENLKAELAVTRKNIKELENEIELGEGFKGTSQSSLFIANKLLEDSQKDDATKGIRDKIGLINGRLETLYGSKERLQASLEELEEDRINLQNNINKLQQRHYKEELNLAKVDTDIENMQERIWEEYELTYSSALEYKAEEYNLRQGLIAYNKTRKAIDNLGYVNVNAIEDSKVLEERFEELDTQAKDLNKAESDLTQIIRELSEEMLNRFNIQFEIINRNFAKVFRELFGGGNASLILTEPEIEGDLLTQGIDIIAEPPGKKLQNITLLSGGEKALTAIAILFAILKLRPMPFCLLDEIEAALDEANVGRFAKYLHNFSGETQFIVITHRKPTMELADGLYGVTMQEKGVSKIVSVKLSEAVENASAGGEA